MASERLFDGVQEVGFGGEAFEALDLLAGAVEDQGDGQDIQVVLGAEGFAAQGDRVIHRVLFEEGTDAIGVLVVSIHAEYGDSLF